MRCWNHVIIWGFEESLIECIKIRRTEYIVFDVKTAMSRTQCPISLFQCEWQQCVQVSVWIKDWSVCAKTSNCSFLLPDASSPRLLSYRHLLAMLPNSSPYVIINILRSWVAEKLMRLHQSTQSPPEHRFSLCICPFFIPLPPLVVFPGPKSHRMWPRVECDFVPQEWICQKAHYQCGGAGVIGL